MITRKEYREQVNERKNRQVLTDKEFFALPDNKKLMYATLQRRNGLPVTVEQDTYFDTHKHKAKKSEKAVSNEKVIKGYAKTFLGLSSLIDLVATFCKI